MELRNSQWISSNDKLDQIFHWFSGKIQAYARHNPLRNACDPNHVTPYSFSLTALCPSFKSVMRVHTANSTKFNFVFMHFL